MATNRNNALRGQTVDLKIQYYNSDGVETDPSETPTIKIEDVNGRVIVKETSFGVVKLDTGLFVYRLPIELEALAGLWTDTWNATVDDLDIENSFTFLVTDESSESSSSGSVRLGDDVLFDFSDEELEGINVLLKYLKARLRSAGKKPKRDSFGAIIRDGYGEIQYEECNVFSDEILATFLCISLSEFNSTPFFTSYSFADQVIKTLFSSIIVEGAYVVGLASQSLLEKGRDFTISDGGISYQPPQLGDFLSSHYGNWLNSHRERVKFVKMSIRPGPRGFGTYTNLASGAPAFVRLRHLRQRRIV